MFIYVCFVYLRLYRFIALPLYRLLINYELRTMNFLLNPFALLLIPKICCVIRIPYLVIRDFY